MPIAFDATAAVCRSIRVSYPAAVPLPVATLYEYSVFPLYYRVSSATDVARSKWYTYPSFRAAAHSLKPCDVGLFGMMTHARFRPYAITIISSTAMLFGLKVAARKYSETASSMPGGYSMSTRSRGLPTLPSLIVARSSASRGAGASCNLPAKDKFRWNRFQSCTTISSFMRTRNYFDCSNSKGIRGRMRDRVNTTARNIMATGMSIGWSLPAGRLPGQLPLPLQCLATKMQYREAPASTECVLEILVVHDEPSSSL